MKHLFAWICLLGSLAGLTVSCSDDEDQSPLAVIDGITATPAPGSITLNWEVTGEVTPKYVEVRYSIPDLEKSYRKQVSQYATSLEVTDLLQKYGTLEFTLQAFNDNNRGGEIHRISAQAEKALPVLGNAQKLALQAASMYTNAPFPTRPFSALIDGDVTTFFHSQWQTEVRLPHYIVVDLGEAVDAFSFRSVNTNRAGDNSWKTVEIYGSDSYDPQAYFDGVAFVHGDEVDLSGAGVVALGTVTDIPGDVSATYTSETITTDRPVRWLWFKVTETTDGTRPFFALAELDIYKYSVVNLE